MTIEVSNFVPAPTILFLLKRVDCNDGVASHLDSLVSGLAQRGWRIIVVSGPVHEKKAAEARYNSIRSSVIDWIVLDRFSGGRAFACTNRQILEIIRKFDVKIVHIQGLSLLLHAALLKIRSGRKIVASYLPSIHSDDPQKLKTTLSKIEILKYAAILHLCRPDAIIAISSEVVRLFAGSCRYPSRHVAKILLGIDTVQFRPPTPSERTAAREKLGLAPEDVVIILPGRLNWNKGHDLLIAAAKELRQKHPHISTRYVFPGTGHQSEQIRRTAHDASDDPRAFVFTGYVDDLRSVLFAADIAVLPSRHEGFGLVIAEAMACGLPIIRTPSGGFDDQVREGVNGFGVPFNDVSALADKISMLLDETLRKKMGAAALEHSRQFDAKKMISDTEALYKTLMQVEDV